MISEDKQNFIEQIPFSKRDVGVRVDKLLSERTQSSRSKIQSKLQAGTILVDGACVPKNYKVRVQDVEAVIYEDSKPQAIPYEKIALAILFEDEDIIVLNKEKGMLVHPISENIVSGTLVNALLFHTNGALATGSTYLRPGIVHRIDRDTSGLLVVAKSQRAYDGLLEQVQNYEMERRYLGVVVGTLPDKTGTIDMPLMRDQRSPLKRVVGAEGINAVTHYEVEAYFESYTLACFRLETGRTHQIRAHMAYIGHPLAGDSLYKKGVLSPAERALHGQCLHAYALIFLHPVTGERISFEAPVPMSFTKFLSQIT